VLDVAEVAPGDVKARFEVTVVDVSGYFGTLSELAQAAGTTADQFPANGLDRDVELFLLRWDSEAQEFVGGDVPELQNKHIVVLLHGWQTLVGFGSDQDAIAPHLTTWRHFLEYATGAALDGPDLGDACEFFTVRYDSDQRIYDNAAAIWKGLATRFPDQEVTILAHGGGGVIAHAMYQKYHPGAGDAFVDWENGGIKWIVTLNSPFHGTPLVQMLHLGGMAPPQQPVVVGAPLAFLACKTPGSLDLAWDDFDSSSLTLWANSDLLALNVSGPLDLSDAYFTYATGLSAGEDAQDASLAATGARIQAVFGENYENDGVVPVKSAGLYYYFDSRFRPRTTAQGAQLGGYSHLQIHSGKAAGDQNKDGYDEALYAVVLESIIPSRDGMVLVPGGSFQMGDALGEDYGLEPIHQVHVSPFYMGRSEVTNEQMRDVLQWAYDGGRLSVDTGTSIVRNKAGTAQGSLDLSEYDSQILLDLNDAASQIFFNDNLFTVVFGKKAYPCVAVTWYGAAAYANYKSEMEGRDPCFSLKDWSCDFSKNGYRLPTEAEWEKAARRRLSGTRFPWGDTITHQQANYRSIVAYSYDVSATRGLHPDYRLGTDPNYEAAPAPVGSFTTNDYDLVDMAGNVWEWCYDWYDSGWYKEPEASIDNPTGPESGSKRVSRGGSAEDNASNCRCSTRLGTTPSKKNNMLGFRVALGF